MKKAKLKQTLSSLGVFVRSQRKYLGITQVELAKKCGSDDSSICRIENSQKGVIITDQLLKRMAKVLDCPVEELIKRRPKILSTPPKYPLGEFIRQRREKLGLSIQVFAKRMKIKTRSAYTFEIKANQISYQTAKRLAKALKINSGELTQFIGFSESEGLNDLGQLIRCARKKAGLSQKDLADKLGFKRQYLSSIELGDRKPKCCSKKLYELAQILNIEISEIEKFFSDPDA